MLLRLSYVAILIAVACFQVSIASEGLLKKLTDTVKSDANQAETKETTNERNKRALYYQNDLISNQERQLRKRFPLGAATPLYGGLGLGGLGGLGGVGALGGLGGLGSAYYGLPLYDYYGLYDYLLYDPLLASYAYPLYGPGVVGGVDPFLVQPANPNTLPSIYDYYYDDLINAGAIPLAARKDAPMPSQGASFNLAARPAVPQQGFMPVPQQNFYSPIAPQHLPQQQQFVPPIHPDVVAAAQQQQQQQQQQQYSQYQRDKLNAIKAASSKSSNLNQ